VLRPEVASAAASPLDEREPASNLPIALVAVLIGIAAGLFLTAAVARELVPWGHIAFALRARRGGIVVMAFGAALTGLLVFWVQQIGS